MAPTFYGLAGSRLAKLPLSRYTDALLYLGPRESLVMAFPSRESIEPEYLKEIDRRSMIEWGELRGRKYLFSRD